MNDGGDCCHEYCLIIADRKEPGTPEIKPRYIKPMLRVKKRKKEYRDYINA